MKNARNTAAKSVILDLILSSKVALSHSEIQIRANGLCDRVTIYRVLGRLINQDLIHKTVTLDGTVKYAGCIHSVGDTKHNHVHFSCTKCLSVTCLNDVEPKFSLPADYLVSEVNFTLAGLCPICI